MKKVLFKLLILCLIVCSVLCIFSACGEQGMITPPSESYTGDKDSDIERPKGTKELKVTTNIPEAVTVSGSGYYKYNDDIRATATIKDGYEFLGWYVNDDDCVSNQTVYNGKMWNQDVEFSAKVIKIPDNVAQSSTQQGTNKNYTLDVETIDANYGLVSLDNQSNQEKYTASYRQGQSFKVLAYSKTSDRFVGWYGLSGELITTNATFTMTMPYFDYMLVAVWGNLTKQWDSQKLYYSSVNGGYAVVDYQGDATSITIPLTYNNKPVIEITNNCFANNNDIVEINISENIKTIGASAFRNCNSLNSINVSDDNNYYKSIDGTLYSKNGEKVYWISKQTSNFIISNGVTSIVDYAFSGCTGLQSITIPDSVTSIGAYAFMGCTGLQSITISDYVTNMGGYAFSGCNNLKQLVIGNNLQSIGDRPFDYCPIENVQMPTTAISYVPKGYLETVEITNGDRIEDYAFSGSCLRNIILPDTLKSIGEKAFAYCSSLESITIPNSLVNIGELAFTFCDKLSNIYYEGTINEWVSKIDGLDSLMIGGLRKTLYINNNSVNDIKNIVLDNTIQEIQSCAFYCCSGLQSITIPSNITKIGWWAFSGCNSLKTIYYNGTISDWAGKIDGIENLISDDRTIYINNEPLKAMTNITLNGLTEIKPYAFSGCDKLSEILIPNGVTIIGDYAFKSCEQLTDVTIPNTVNIIGAGAFQWSGLSSVAFGNSVERIESYAFSYCYSLLSIEIPDSVKHIDARAFFHCNLHEATFDNMNGWRISVNEDMSDAVYIASSSFMDKRTAAHILSDEDWFEYYWERR